MTRPAPFSRAALALGLLMLGACAPAEDATQSFDWTEIGGRTDLVAEIAYGRTHAGTLSADRLQAVSFHAEAGDVVSAFATPVPRDGSALEPVLILYGPIEDDAAPMRAVAPASPKNAHIIDEPIEVAGSYMVAVGDDARGGGDYRLRLACTGGGCRPPTVEADGEPCALSQLGDTVLAAALAADQSRNTVPAAKMVSYENRAFEPFVTGPEIFPAMADAIALAEAEVDLAFFVYDYSDGYEEIVDALARLESRQIARGAETPVVVRFVVDAQKILFNTGSKIAKRAFDGIADLRLDPNYVQVLIATYEHLTLGNLHSKLVVVDGTQVWLGGANIQKQHDYESPWMDSFYALEGHAAQTFLADFDHAWNKSVRWHCARDERDEPVCVEWDEAPGAWHPASVLDPDFGALDGACVPAIALNRTAWGGFNNNVDNPMGQGILAAIDAAEQRIRIQTPNLNDDAVKDAIVRAVARGVHVEILLALGFNDLAMKLFGGTNEDNVASLTERVRSTSPEYAERLQFRWYSADGVVAIDGNVPGASHLKYMSIDGRMAIVGSTNMDTLAWNHSREANVAIDRASITARWDGRVFEPNWNRAIPVPQ